MARRDSYIEHLTQVPLFSACSQDELRKLTGEYFGYHYDLPRREREQARERWQKWWYESGRARNKT
jgi:hypothetical protein